MCSSVVHPGASIVLLAGSLVSTLLDRWCVLCLCSTGLRLLEAATCSKEMVLKKTNKKTEGGPKGLAGFVQLGYGHKSHSSGSDGDCTVSLWV